MLKRLFSMGIALVCASISLMAGEHAKPVVSILGDSYSTFEGYIPEGHHTWYYTAVDLNRTDVNRVQDTWWWQVVNEGGYKLGVNNSFSGSTVSYTGYNGENYQSRSFITRLPHLGSPDILLIFGGTNDSWTGGPIGEFQFDNLTLGHLFEFRPALGKLLTEAKNRYPGTRIVFMINTELKDEVTSSIITLCKKFDIEYIQLKDIDKRQGHPTIKGMTAIKDQVLTHLKK